MKPIGRLVDGFGRIATDLRVSVTDRCNLRCTYCMPEEGLDWLAKPDLLTDDELIRVISVAVSLGVTDVRFTGGEPLLRPGLASIIAATSASGAKTALTTNGIGLASAAPSLAAAGLHRINVSLDTVDRDTFVALTRRDRLDDVLAGLAAAQSHGLSPVKVNAVLIRGVNDGQAGDLLEFCLQHNYELRFIEQMPLDAQHGWQRNGMVTAGEILELLQGRFELEPDDQDRGSAPAETWLVNGGPQRVGIIASVTRPFCGDCDRIRLTADGQIRNCLFARDESDVRNVLRSGGSDQDIAAVLTGSIAAKKAGHGIGDPGFVQPLRPMSSIGG